MEKKNSSLIVVISIFATLAVVLIIFCAFLFFNPSNTKKTDIPDDILVEDVDTNKEETEELHSVPMYVSNVANSIYLRTSPEEKSDNIITTIAVGSEIIWYEDTTPVFSKISFNGTEGYVKRDYLSTTPPSTNSAASTPAPGPTTSNTTVVGYRYVANVKNSIYLRSSAAENPNNIITTIPLGTKVGFIEHANNVFDKISYNGSIGYAKSCYLSNYSTGYNYMTVYNVKHSIYLRSAPKEDPNNIICEIPVNSTVQYISSAGNGFYQISWNGYTGYSKSMYLR